MGRWTCMSSSLCGLQRSQGARLLRPPHPSAFVRTEIAGRNSCGCTAVAVRRTVEGSCSRLLSTHPKREFRSQLQRRSTSAAMLGKRGPLRRWSSDQRDEASLPDSLLTRVMHDVANGMLPALNRGSCAWRVKPRMSSYTSKAFHKCLQAALVASLSTHDRRSRKPRAFPPRRRIYSSWRADQCVFAQDRAMCGKSCSGRSSTGGVRDVAREVAQNWPEWMSSSVASRNKCTKQGSCTSCTANEKPYQG